MVSRNKTAEPLLPAEEENRAASISGFPSDGHIILFNRKKDSGRELPNSNPKT
jgi:hypothetical protein